MSEIINKVVSVDALHPHARNYRGHPDTQIQQLGMSHARFGQFRSVVVKDAGNGTYTIVAGHGIIEAMKRNGVQRVRADVLPPDVSEEDVIGIMVADNTHAQNAQDDDALLAHLLQEQQDAGFDLASLGSDDETLRQMLDALGDEVLEQGDREDEIPGINAPDLPYKNQFAVAVMCGSEEEQKNVFDALVEQGYTCKVLVV